MKANETKLRYVCWLSNLLATPALSMNAAHWSQGDASIAQYQSSIRGQEKIETSLRMLCSLTNAVIIPEWDNFLVTRDFSDFSIHLFYAYWRWNKISEKTSIFLWLGVIRHIIFISFLQARRSNNCSIRTTCITLWQMLALESEKMGHFHGSSYDIYFFLRDIVLLSVCLLSRHRL